MVLQTRYHIFLADMYQDKLHCAYATLVSRIITQKRTNVTVLWLALLPRIYKVSGLNLGWVTSYTDRFFVNFLSPFKGILEITQGVHKRLLAFQI